MIILYIIIALGPESLMQRVPNSSLSHTTLAHILMTHVIMAPGPSPGRSGADKKMWATGWGTVLCTSTGLWTKTSTRTNGQKR